jgi:hypothetical protein
MISNLEKISRSVRVRARARVRARVRVTERVELSKDSCVVMKYYHVLKNIFSLRQLSY